MPTLESPCIRNCCLDRHDICIGCFRSLDDILQWGNATEQQKCVILDAVKVRKENDQTLAKVALNDD
jgi:predicted Fe-S protein YdhL (DUF1289 family)